MANPGMTKRERRDFVKENPNPHQPNQRQTASELEQRAPVKEPEPTMAKKKTKKKATKKKKKA